MRKIQTFEVKQALAFASADALHVHAKKNLLEANRPTVKLAFSGTEKISRPYYDLSIRNPTHLGSELFALPKDIHDMNNSSNELL